MIFLRSLPKDALRRLIAEHLAKYTTYQNTSLQLNEFVTMEEHIVAETKASQIANSVRAKLGPLGPYLNSPKRALIYVHYYYALQPSKDAITRHLGEKRGIIISERRGLAAIIYHLCLPDPNTLANRPNGSTSLDLV